MDFTRSERISLKLHPEFNEKWVQELIAADPSILGLGELVLRDKERIQPRTGRLDLLLQDLDTKRRFEVEVQLGPTDEAHIIRTIEYWDIERKRYPQYEHCAVLIAEDVTSRFLNVVSLFNGAIPLIDLQMQALKVGNLTTLIFTKVLDELSRGVVDEDEDAAAAPTDRAYWEERSSKQTVKIVDELLVVAKEIEPTLELKYNKFYIGLSRGGQAFNFAYCTPRKKWVVVGFKIPKGDEIDAKLDNSGLEGLYDVRAEAYKLSLRMGDVVKHRNFMKELMVAAYNVKNT